MSSAALHQFGRDALLEAWPQVTGRAPSLTELQMAGAVAALESGYGTFAFINRETGEKIRNTNNWGAVQCKSLPPCPEGCFEASDTKENGQSFQACFRHPATPAEGAAIFVKEVTLRRPNSWAAMQTGDIDSFASHMHAEHYFGGFGATVEDRVNNYAHAIELNANEIAAKLGEPLMVRRGGPAGPGNPAGGAEGDGAPEDIAACLAGLGLVYYLSSKILQRA